MEYDFREIEKKWQRYWKENNVYKSIVNPDTPKYYVLEMFPYPSGAGLHVGHPLGYIAGDIYARYKRLKGFNVLHPMGYDAYGLPAEQYAIQTGQHPAITTEQNIKRYRQQLDILGFSYDWSREVRTCDPEYYKWTQWAFIRMFNSYYLPPAPSEREGEGKKEYSKGGGERKEGARPIAELIAHFEKQGTADLNAVCGEPMTFSAAEWKTKTEKEQQEILLNYRLAYLADMMVNWCPTLGTVLANDEVVNGVSVRGGHPVERKLMKQWSLRITAYAQRLLDGLDKIEWSDSLKEIQRNWIGRSEGGSALFPIAGGRGEVQVFTTRPDTIFGVTFMVVCPEYEGLNELTTKAQRQEVEEYVNWAKNRSERERQAEVKKVSGVFTGAYAVHPFTGKEIPIWVSEYVLAGYGTGAIMAVPAHDSRDFAFARHFNLPIVQVVVPTGEKEENPAEWTESKDSKEGVCINSDFINGLSVKEGGAKVIDRFEAMGIGTRKVNFRLRDAIFSRQRYWGEPFPVYYKDGMPYMLSEDELPLLLPEVDKYLPTESGEPPLARAKNWKTKEGYPLETSTMPGFAGSSAYYFRYMDPRNNQALASSEAINYWQDVDLYIGGAEHATGHLIYARFWNMFLYDLGLCPQEEPFKKLINQGMIQGRSNFVYRIKGSNKFVSYNLRKEYETDTLHVDINIVDNDVLDLDAFRRWRPEFSDAEFILENGKYICGHEIEKMSKSMYNVQNPDDLVERYGADTLRLYEMFLGPLEQSKPWDTKGIEGTARFIKKLWRLYHDNENIFTVSTEPATKEELKALHKLIKKIADDIERFSFNTAVSAFMICVNELSDLKCNKQEILEPLCITIAPFAPHIAEELWRLLGHETSVTQAVYPNYNETYTAENSFEYPVSVNGKMRFKMEFSLDMPTAEIEKNIVAAEEVQKWLEGKAPKKIIVVQGKIINVVI